MSRSPGKPGFGQAIYVSPLRWVIVSGAARHRLFLFGPHQCNVGCASARNAFFVFSGSHRPLDVGAAHPLYRRIDRPQVFFETAAAFLAA